MLSSTPQGRYHGLSRPADRGDVSRTPTSFIDMGTHGELAGGGGSGGRPGVRRRRARHETDEDAEGARRRRDGCHATISTTPKGRNIGTGSSSAPTAGLAGGGCFIRSLPRCSDVAAPPADAPFTTVMNWQAYEPIEFRGQGVRSEGCRVRKIHLDFLEDSGADGGGRRREEHPDGQA